MSMIMASRLQESAQMTRADIYIAGGLLVTPSFPKEPRQATRSRGRGGALGRSKSRRLASVLVVLMRLIPRVMHPVGLGRQCWSIVGILPAKAAIAGKHIGNAGFDRVVFTVPVYATVAVLHHGAPRRIPEILGVTRGDIEAN